ncbi:MAG: TetR family transcriptional regulator [Rhodobacteraceae bacterium]|nr:TetR family transcriptional regulator [Paracoccaceae bacterium]MCB2123017.1 TetR family transcriptional regulator [Paracoccaceae bacterium]MCB2131282.1 TetR family transcriptional regulator [Paracoccaceae bacterium]MCB2138891.1 TetR family transcriptional regulator [Paracoccaceae bacterium]MCB2150902.1 TetR family transcriptional regulator [Paracoccaceae bacterium]
MRKPANLRRAEIVVKVIDLADRIGPDRVTTAAVAKAIGVTQAALFRHFPTKADMWGATADHVAETLSQAWAEAMAQEDDPVLRLKSLITAQLNRIAATPALPMLLFSRELNAENADLRLAFRNLLTAFHGHIVRAATGAQESGQLRRDIQATDIAVLLSSLVQGVAIRWSLGARGFPLREEGLRLLDIQLHLLAARKNDPCGNP